MRPLVGTMAEYSGPERVNTLGDKVYIIRDVWAAPYGSAEWRNMKGRRLVRCEYAVLVKDRPYFMQLEWFPCEEGVQYASIQPAFTLADLTPAAAAPTSEAT